MMKVAWALNEPLSEFDRRDAHALVQAMDLEEFQRTAAIAKNAGVRESRARLLLPRLTPLVEFRLSTKANTGRQLYEWRRRRRPLSAIGKRILGEIA